MRGRLRCCQRCCQLTSAARDGGGQLVLLGTTGGPVRIGEGRKPLKRSQTLSENSQMASGAVSATGSPEVVSPAPNSTPIPARRANGPPMRPIEHQRPRKQSGSPHQVAQKNPVPEPGAELRAEKGGLVMDGEESTANVNKSPTGASGSG